MVYSVIILPLWENSRSEINGLLIFESYKFQEWMLEQMLALSNLCTVMFARIAIEQPARRQGDRQKSDENLLPHPQHTEWPEL